ncbi:PASTA domain, binds beta-lactams [Lishizhenia tianjinensis]|uniref:PASTA domain, binds beta-lactams n=1 Tax=Lishizhenia tianjinensis TaxID=477690 RepID=A0A1I7BM44_9FLAO|nr:PASTA domain-containing protein [Lishizhenia tianjinensis]SFT88250.1 PASTA domain, binds beta-lactams [Lishizhenia tianjinensis]
MSLIKKTFNLLTSKAFWINILLIVLAWVAIIWGALSYFNSTTKHGEKIEVPTLVSDGKEYVVNIKDVETLLNGSGLEYEVLDSVYKPGLVDGTVIYQDPLPTVKSGQYVKSGRKIKLRVSKRTRNVKMPKLIDKSQRFAEALITTVGLRSKTTYVASETPGSVLKVKYRGKEMKYGEQLPINSVVELVVGRNANGELLPVPNLYGLTINEAQTRLNASVGLNLYVSCPECVSAADSAKAIINAQTPVAGEGSMVPSGATITAFATLNFVDNREVEP